MVRDIHQGGLGLKAVADLDACVFGKRVLSESKVRRLPVGTVIQMHYLDKDGNHQWKPVEVVISHRRKMLCSRDWRDSGHIMRIWTHKYIRYTEV